MTEGFNLQHIAKNVLKTARVAEPAAAWDHVMRVIPPHLYAEALNQIGPRWIKDALLMYGSRPAGDDDRADEPTPTPAPTQTRRARAYVDRRVFVGEWKFLADCTPDDLDVAVQLHHDKAAAVTAEAERYERLAKVCRDRGVETVGDLDDAEVEEALQ